MRPQVLTCKDALFAGHDDGAEKDHARYFRVAPHDLRVVTNVDHNVHTIHSKAVYRGTNLNRERLVGQANELVVIWTAATQSRNAVSGLDLIWAFSGVV
jgi:hypothetical protein